MALNLAALVLWTALIALCLHFGREAAPWIEGTGRWWVTAALAAAGALGLAGGAWALRRLAPGRRLRAGLVLLAAGAGLGLVAWWQAAFIERIHLLLYGVAGLLAFRLTRPLAPGAWALYWAVLLAAGVGLADELAQYVHPRRVGDPVDALSNAAAAGLCAWAAWALWPPGPKKAQGPRGTIWAIMGLLGWAAGLAVLWGVSP